MTHGKVWCCESKTACTSEDRSTLVRHTRIQSHPTIIQPVCCLSQVILRQILLISYSLSLDSELIIYRFPVTWMQQPSYSTTFIYFVLDYTHLPCAHWKGRSHNSRSPMISWLWLRVSGSPNLMALWHAKLLRMARRVGGTICGGWPASVHYGYTVRCNVTVNISSNVYTRVPCVYCQFGLCRVVCAQHTNWPQYIRTSMNSTSTSCSIMIETTPLHYLCKFVCVWCRRWLRLRILYILLAQLIHFLTFLLFCFLCLYSFLFLSVYWVTVGIVYG